MELFGEKIKRLRKEKGVNLVDVATAIGVNKSAVSFWENGTNEPKASYIKSLADYFDVTTDYLLGREDEWGSATQSTPIQKAPAELTEDEKKLIELYDQLTPERQKDLLTFAKTFAQMQGDEARKISKTY